MRTSRASERASVHFLSRRASDTRDIGTALGRLLSGTEVIHLVGGLGAGKTCFIQGLALGLGIGGAASAVSPSFTLINEYSGAVPLYHVDLYRLDKPEEVRRLGLEEYYGRGVVAVEWAERLPRDMVGHCIEISLSPRGDRQRQITITALDRPSAAIIRGIGKIRRGHGPAAPRNAPGG